MVVANVGKTAARDVGGQLELDSNLIQPRRPDEGENQYRAADGKYIYVEIEKIMPGPDPMTEASPLASHSQLRFFVWVYATGATPVKYRFVSSEGAEAEGTLRLNIPEIPEQD